MSNFLDQITPNLNSSARMSWSISEILKQFKKTRSRVLSDLIESRRVFSGFGKAQNILTGNGIWLQPGSDIHKYLGTGCRIFLPQSVGTRNPVQTQVTVYELSRSPRNEDSFEAKAKRPTTKYKTKRKKQILGFDAIGKLCRHGRIIYYSSQWNGKKNWFVIVSQRINFHSFSFQIAVYLTLFVIDF